jgi:hypothetical protein
VRCASGRGTSCALRLRGNVSLERSVPPQWRDRVIPGFTPHQAKARPRLLTVMSLPPRTGIKKEASGTSFDYVKGSFGVECVLSHLPSCASSCRSESSVELWLATVFVLSTIASTHPNKKY